VVGHLFERMFALLLFAGLLRWGIRLKIRIHADFKPRSFFYEKTPPKAIVTATSMSPCLRPPRRSANGGRYGFCHSQIRC